MIEVPDKVIGLLRAKAKTGEFDGLQNARNQLYIRRCSSFHGASGTIVLFTHDSGHHTSGWMKNPDYERCLHLSLSFREPIEVAPDWLVSIGTLMNLVGTRALAPFDKRQAAHWVERVFGDDQRYAWCEPAFSKKGKELEVMHWRVFCDGAWRPFKPRGEVYSTEFTEERWKSWSEVQGEGAEPNWVSAD